jgi:diacylglycerol kinase (ATP)
MKTFFRKRLASFQHAWDGFSFLLKNEMNARIHVAITVVVILLGIVLEVSRVEWILLILTIGVVIAAEAVNTALEQLVDLVSPKYHLLAKRAKDLAAAAVLLLAVVAVIIGILVFVPRLNTLFFS